MLPDHQPEATAVSEPEQSQTPAPRWSWRKKLLVWGGGAGLVIGAIVVAVFAMTRPLVHTVDGFFDDLKAGAVEQAYERSSSQFKRSASVDAFRRHIEKYRLSAVETTSWSNRTVQGFSDGSVGGLDGSATDSDGTVRPLSMTLVKEGGMWRIHNVAIKPAGVVSFGQTRDIPEERELINLTHDLVVVFSRSLKDRSLQAFHEAISERWRREQSVEALETAFKPFLDAELDLSPVEAMTPVFDTEPAIDARGWLVVTGHYEVGGDRLLFEQSFVPEGLGWKLAGLSLNIQPQP